MLAKNKIKWSEIDTVLLDMDGTLFDRHYEDYFWEVEIPKQYAIKTGMTFKEAKALVMELYFKQEKSLNWSNVEYWEKELGLELWNLRFQLKHLVKLHPHTLRFLRFLKKQNKKIYLVTASPQRDIEFKLGHSKIFEFFDGVCTAHEFNLPKQDILFWKKLQKKLKYSCNRTLFVDDKEDMINAAELSGIKWIIFKSKFSSKLPPKIPKKMLYVHHFDDIIP